MKIYIAGPMAGYPELNFPAFFDAAEMFREVGHTVFNPAEKKEETESVVVTAPNNSSADNLAFLRTVLEKDLSWICREADSMWMLKGWEKSYGARAEHALAVALGLEIMYE